MKRILNFITTLVSIAGLLLLGGCGGGGLTDSATTINSGTKVGKLVDSAVANIGYRTISQSGYTNANGEFEYKDGEDVTFFVGNIEFPTSGADSLLTPLDMSNTDDILSPMTINIIRLLQSLDEDGNPENGIVIPDSAAVAASTPISFNVSEEDFELQPSVINLVSHSGSINTQLVHPDGAVSHCAQSLGIDFKVGPFVASYSDNDMFIASETVDRPSINYSWADFHGIDSPNFQATWKGNLEVLKDPKLIDINFEVSWSDVSLFIDGVEISTWSNSNRTIQHMFQPGVHEIVVGYKNNWHTTGFNMSFTTNIAYTKEQAASLIASRIDANTQVIYVGAYESGDLYGNSIVTLESTAKKVFLFLSSYNSVNWVINNPHDVRIAGIAYGSYSNVSTTVTAGRSSPTFKMTGLSYGYGDFSAPTADIQNMIGRGPDFTAGAYSLTNTTISVP